MNEYGMCETVGKALISHQDASTFSRLFEAWKNMLQLTDPILFMTDGDAAIASAVAETLPFSNHILCTWHIIVQNGTTHLCKIMSNINFDIVSGMLWDICLKEDYLDKQIIIQVYLKTFFIIINLRVYRSGTLL
jgi:uroporphyrinogen-III decarboxylase